MFDPGKRRHVKDFLEHRRRCYKAMEAMRSNRQHLLDLYLGDSFGTSNKPRPVNLTRLFVDVFRQSLVAQNPRVMVSTKGGARRMDALDLAAALNYYIEKMHLHWTIERWVTESLFAPLGVVKIGLTEDPMPDGWLRGHSEGRVFVDNISFDDWVQNLEEYEWTTAYQGHKYTRDLDDLLADDEIDRKDKERLKRESEDGDPWGTDSNETKDILKPGTSDDSDDSFRKKRVLWDIWFPRERLLVTFANTLEDAGRPLKVRKWENRPARGPFLRLQYDVVIDNLLSLPPVSVVEHLDELENVVIRKLGKQAEREKQINVVSGVRVKEGQRTLDANDGDTIVSDHPNPVTELRFGGPDNQLTGFAEVVKQWASYISGNLDVVGGLRSAGDTLGQERILNENSSQRVTFMQNRGIAAVTGLLEDIAWYVLDDKTLRIPRLMRKWSPAVDTMLEFDYPRESFNSTFEDFGFQIEPFSMRVTSPGEKLQQMRQIWREDILANPYLAEQGIVPNVQRFLEYVREYTQVPVDELVEVAAPMEQAGHEPRQSPHTVRENVRRNTGGGGEMDGSNIQQLMGGISGGQSAA